MWSGRSLRSYKYFHSEPTISVVCNIYPQDTNSSAWESVLDGGYRECNLRWEKGMCNAAVSQMCLCHGWTPSSLYVMHVQYIARDSLPEPHEVFKISDTMPPGGTKNDSLYRGCSTVNHTPSPYLKVKLDQGKSVFLITLPPQKIHHFTHFQNRMDKTSVCTKN